MKSAVLAVVIRQPVELIQLLHQSPSKWFSDLVLNWRIPPGRWASFTLLGQQSLVNTPQCTQEKSLG